MSADAPTRETISAALEAYLEGQTCHHLMSLLRTQRDLARFSSACVQVCGPLSKEAGNWQERLVDFFAEERAWSLSFVQYGQLLPLLAPKFQVRMLEVSLDSGVYVDSDLFAGVLCRCCLYGLRYLSKSCLFRNRARLAAACRELGPAWDRSVGLCFAAGMPACLLRDEDFVRSGIAYVNDEGHSLQWLSSMMPCVGKRRDVALDFVRRQLCLQHTDFVDDEEVVLAALQHKVVALDACSLRLRRGGRVLEEAAKMGPSFFLTSTGKGLRGDRDLVLLAASQSPRDLLALLPTLVSESLQRDPVVLAAVVHGLAKNEDATVESVRGFLSMPETRCETFYRALLKRSGKHLGLLEAPLRARRDLVLLAVRSDASSVMFAEEAVWNDAGCLGFVAALLLAGCPWDFVPPSAWSQIRARIDPVGFAATLLLKNRKVWAEMPRDVQEALPDCLNHRCSVCWNLPQEIRACAPVSGANCRNYFCDPCMWSIAKHFGRVTCPVCRLPQIVGRSCGGLAWDAEILVQREREYRASKRQRVSP